MIGAMPAVAVRHERRRGEKRGGGRRPSQLALQIGRPLDPDGRTPSPDRHRSELYVCGKVAFLHAVVGSVLLGIVVLVVGLVQFSPGAEAAQQRYYLMGCGSALLGAGILGAVTRCLCLHWFNRRYRCEDVEEPEPQPKHHAVTDTKKSHSHEKHEKSTPDKPRLKSQASVSVDLFVKQPSASSDT